MNISYPNKEIPISDNLESALLAMLIFGEARNQSTTVQLAVGCVVRNRVMSHINFWKKGQGLTDWHKVILHPYAFSCFNKTDTNLKKILDPYKYEKKEIWDICCGIANEIMFKVVADITNQSDHYFDNTIKAPYWADPGKFVMKIGTLNFYRLYIKTHL